MGLGKSCGATAPPQALCLHPCHVPANPPASNLVPWGRCIDVQVGNSCDVQHGPGSHDASIGFHAQFFLFSR